MHLKAYRFSVAWTRIAPNGGTDWNEEGFAYYDTLVDALLEAGIEPYVTLYHWDLPQALEEKGGWRSEETARAFASYAAKMAEHFKGRVHQWFTFNEPACIVKMGYGTGEHAPGLNCRWKVSLPAGGTLSTPTALPHRSCAMQTRKTRWALFPPAASAIRCRRQKQTWTLPGS